MPDDQPRTITPPYLAFASFKNFVAGIRQTGLPGRIDKSIMGNMSGATQSSLMLTLKYLKLIEDDGAPTPALSNLVEGPEQNMPSIYASLISTSYAFVGSNKVNLESATQKQLDEAFETQNLNGDTRRKAISFFVLLATEAGMKISGHLKSAKRKSSGIPRKSRSKKENAGDEEVGSPAFAAPLPAQDAPGHKTYVLDLTVDGKRMIKVTAPTDITADDIERLSGWMHFQYNVEWKKPAASK